MIMNNAHRAVALTISMLGASMTYAADAPATAPVIPDWLSRISLSGDVRYRVERSDDSTEEDIRNRHRLRARLAVDAKVSNDFSASIGLTTTENGDPRSGNQTMDGENSRKLMYIDVMYIDWKASNNLHVLGGKMLMPFFRPGQSLFFDSDINPEGIAFKYTQGKWFGSAYGYWLDENVVNTGTTTGAADTMWYGAQFGRSLELGKSRLTLAMMYSDLSSAQGRRPFFNNTASGSNGNSVIGTGTAAVLAHDFRTVELSAQWDTQLGKLPFQVWADAARNLDPDELNTAWTTGVLLGKASAAKSWQAGISYQVFDKDALFGQLIDSDFAGVTDSNSLILRGAYAFRKNVTADMTYFISHRNVDVGTETDLNRLLAQFNVKF